MAALALILAGLWLARPALERGLIYFPSSLPRDLRPPRLAAGHVAEIPLRAADGVRIYAWHVVPSESPIATLLFLHGNGGNVATRAGNLENLARVGFEVFMLDYRGYGKSEGTPSEPGLYRDADAAYEHLTGELGRSPEKILLYGESLGSAIAIDLAVRRPVAGVVVEAGFTSVKDVGRIAYPFLPSFVYQAISHRYESLEKIRRLSVPVLVLHGTSDEIIPLEMGRNLYEAAPEPRYWYEVRGARHNDVSETGGDAYYRRLAEFARRATDTDSTS